MLHLSIHSQIDFLLFTSVLYKMGCQKCQQLFRTSFFALRDFWRFQQSTSFEELFVV